MSEFSEQERYCLGLIVLNGGEMDYYYLRELITEFPECYSGLNEKYLRNKKIKNILKKLEEKGSLTRKDDEYKINSIIELGFIQKSPIIIQKAIKNTLEFKKKHVLEFNTSYVEEQILNDEYNEENAPYGLLENLNDALRLFKLGSYDSVLVKCGKCVEIMVNAIDSHYDIFDKRLSTGNMIIQLKQDKTIEKINAGFDRNTWLTYLDGIGLVYKFRNMFGAHDSWEWREDQLAMSCLVLTFYLVDSFMLDYNQTE